MPIQIGKFSVNTSNYDIKLKLYRFCYMLHNTGRFICEPYLQILYERKKVMKNIHTHIHLQTRTQRDIHTHTHIRFCLF